MNNFTFLEIFPRGTTEKEVFVVRNSLLACQSVNRKGKKTTSQTSRSLARGFFGVW
jgi:hypothetical protein